MKTLKTRSKIKIVVLLFVALNTLVGCSNQPSGVYEFVSKTGEVRTIDFISDSIVTISAKDIGLIIRASYMFEDDIVILYNFSKNTVVNVDEFTLQIKENGLLMPGGDLYVKRKKSSATRQDSKLDSKQSTPYNTDNLPNDGVSQEMTEADYNNVVLGTWVGTISGSNLPSKELILVITNSTYNKSREVGHVEGFSTVNDKNKTFFAGTFRVEAELPVLELHEPNTKATNGVFKINSFSCSENQTEAGYMICGSWSSYNGQYVREVNLTRPQ